jgi:hypothetical protein
MVMPAINQQRTHHFLAINHYQHKPITTVISPRDAECRRPELLITNTGLASQVNTASAVAPEKHSNVIKEVPASSALDQGFLRYPLLPAPA